MALNFELTLLTNSILNGLKTNKLKINDNNEVRTGSWQEE